MPKAKLISPVTKQAIQKKRVAAYCRVSSNSADQLHSYDAQVKAYTRLINRNPDWELVEIFADEGISGMKADNRPEFNRMIRMCETRQIDLILTKSVSRFARNVKEALAYVRELKLLGIGVNFEKEGINTLSLGDEMLLNTFSAIAQEESKSISQNQRFSIVKRMESGEFVDSNAPYGFRLVDKHLAVYEPEAEIVRFIFNRYLCGWSISEIARTLSERGISTKYGLAKWKPETISRILQNERYIGDSHYQKTYRDTTVPFKQYKNRGQEDMYYAEDTHPPLLDAETFEQAKTLFDKKRERFAKNDEQNIYPLTGRIRCSECGSSYRRKVRGDTVKWVCAKHFEDSGACGSGYYTEEQIYIGFLTMVNKLRFGEDDILKAVEQKLEAVELAYKQRNREAANISRSISEMNAKLVALEELHRKGYLAGEVYYAQTRGLQKQIADLRKERQNSFSSRILTTLQKVKQLQSILECVEEPWTKFDAKLFESIVEKIEIDKEGKMTVTLLSGLTFTEMI